VPIGIIYATTNVQVTLNVLAEFIGGSWFEGNALAMNFFKSYGYVTTAHTLSFAQDLKLAHYTHIPPRVTFMCQIVATLVSTFVATGVMNFQFTLPNVCDPDNKDHFCRNFPEPGFRMMFADARSQTATTFRHSSLRRFSGARSVPRRCTGE